MARLGFVGLGTMGGPMAGHLAKAGHELTVWNRTPEKALPLEEAGAKVALDLGELAAACDIVFVCVNRSEDVQECLAALTRRARPATLFIDHSTIAPSAAEAIHADLGNRGFRFIDAPITGGSMGAQSGQLTIFCGGSQADIDDAMPYLKCYAKRAERVGGPGYGQKMKMANQIAVGGALLALCETAAFAEKAGLDLAQALDIIGVGAGGSWCFNNYGPKVLQRDWTPGFSVKNQRKDFGYCREAAEQVGAALPGTELVDTLLSRVNDPELTTAALYEVMLAMGDKGPEAG